LVLARLSRSRSPRLGKKSILNLGWFHGRGASFVIIRYAVDPRAHGIAAHYPSIIRLQQFGRRSHILHSGVEPQIVAVWIEDDWHAVALKLYSWSFATYILKPEQF
jgi:hypothetical protein